MPQAFVHLHLHSEFSLVDSTLRLKQLVERTKELGMPAVAITDQFNLFALVKFYRAAVASGIKPIVGADVLLVIGGWHGRNVTVEEAIANPCSRNHLTKQALFLIC